MPAQVMSSNDTSKPDADIKTKTDVNGDKGNHLCCGLFDWRTSSPSRKPLGNGFISLTMLKMPSWFKAVLIASPRSTMVALTFLSFKAPKEEGSSQTSLF